MFSKHNLAGVAVATLVAFSLTACGDSSSKAEAFVKKEYPDAKILSFSEIQKEFGLKDKECLNSKNANLITTHHFIKLPSGEYEILMVMTNSDNGNSIVETTYSNKEMFRTIENFKTQNAECFN